VFYIIPFVVQKGVYSYQRVLVIQENERLQRYRVYEKAAVEERVIVPENSAQQSIYGDEFQISFNRDRQHYEKFVYKQPDTLKTVIAFGERVEHPEHGINCRQYKHYLTGFHACLARKMCLNDNRAKKENGKIN